MGNKQSHSEPEEDPAAKRKGENGATPEEVEADPEVEVPPPMQPITSVQSIEEANKKV